MPQSALTPEEICSSFCLSRSMGLGAGELWANAGRTDNKTKKTLAEFNFIISPQKTQRFTRTENSIAFVFLRVLCGWRFFRSPDLLEALSPHQAHRIRHAATAAARP